VAGRDDEDLGEEFGAVAAANPIKFSFALDRPHARPAMDDSAVGQGPGELLCDVAAEQGTCRKTSSIGQGGGLVQRGDGVCRQPTGEMTIIVRQQAHIGRRYVDAVGRISGGIGEPPAQRTARLKHQDRG